MRYTLELLAITLFASFLSGCGTMPTNSANSNTVANRNTSTTKPTPLTANVEPTPSSNIELPQDRRIKVMARSALARDRDLKDIVIDVEVRNGVVTLTGEVASVDQQSRAAGLVNQIAGVKEVDNQLTVQEQGALLSQTFDIDSEVSRLRVGAVVTELPVFMYVGETRAVALVLSSEAAKAQAAVDQLKNELDNQSRAMPSKNLESRTRIETDKAMFSRFMEARLSGQGFEIRNITPERQPVTKDQNTEWRWEVKAVSAGEHSLYLSMNAIFEGPAGEKTRAINTYSKVVKVDTVRESWAIKTTTFVEDNWKWLLVTIVFPVGGGVWGLLRRKEKAQQQEAKLD